MKLLALAIIAALAFAVLSVRAWRRQFIRERNALREATAILNSRREEQRRAQVVMEIVFLAALGSSRKHWPVVKPILLLEAPEGWR